MDASVAVRKERSPAYLLIKPALFVCCTFVLVSLLSLI